jgi:hypothetical protein
VSRTRPVAELEELAGAIERHLERRLLPILDRSVGLCRGRLVRSRAARPGQRLLGRIARRNRLGEQRSDEVVAVILCRRACGDCNV